MKEKDNEKDLKENENEFNFISWLDSECEKIISELGVSDIESGIQKLKMREQSI